MAESYIQFNTEYNQLRMPEAKNSSNQNSRVTAIQPKVKSNSKIYWILGAVATLILLMGGFFVVTAFGIYLYAHRANTVNAEKYKNPTDSPNLPNKPKSSNPTPKIDSSLITNETIKGVFETKNKVGKFELLKVLETRSTGYFLGADAEAGAIYSGRGKNEDVIIDMATYLSKEKAKNEFIEMVKTDKKQGAKMLGDILEEEKTISTVFQSGKLYVLTFCKLKVDSFTPCYRLSSFNRVALIDFHDSFFGK